MDKDYSNKELYENLLCSEGKTVIFENGTEKVDYPSGTTRWYLDGELHREDGPAVDWNDGDYEYYVHGKIHRTDGPASCIFGIKRWCLNDVEYDSELAWLLALYELGQNDLQ